MKKPKQQQTLFAGNYNQVLDVADKKLKDTAFLPVLLLIGEVMDQAAEGEYVFVTVGRNRGRTAFVLTVTWDGDKMYAPGLDLVAIAEGCASLLEAPDGP